jgi:predicted metal-dependent hydrolase
MADLDCPFLIDESSLRDYFERVAGRPVSLTLTSNSSRMLSFRRNGKEICVRLQRIFLASGREVISEIANFIKRGRGDTPLVRKFLKERAFTIVERRPRRIETRIQGLCHNLRDVYDRINREYFGGRVSCLITWGANSRRRSVKKRTLGSYSMHTNTIRINPVLDRKVVPPYVLEFILYHEMLHADLGVTRRNGRRSVHSREFRDRERLFSQYDKATAWEKKNL